MKLKLSHMTYNVMLISDDGRTAVVRYNGLPAGLGTSIGNAIRRTALTYIPGYAPIGFKLSLSSDIKIVDNIPQVKEDVYQLSNNISSIRIKCLCPEYIDEFYLVYEGDISKELRAKNLVPKGEMPEEFKTGIPNEFQQYVVNGSFDIDRFYLDNVKVLNPELVIFTNGELQPIKKYIRIKCNSGIYFTSSLDRKKLCQDGNHGNDDYTVIQSIYNPVVHAHFKIVPDSNSKFRESLEIIVETDGSISPLEVIEDSSNLLATFFTVFSQNNVVDIKPTYSDFGNTDTTACTEPITYKTEVIMNELTEDLIKDPVMYNAFKIMGLNNKEDILNSLSRGDIKRFFDKANIGYSEEEIKDLLNKSNVSGIKDIEE